VRRRGQSISIGDPRPPMARHLLEVRCHRLPRSRTASGASRPLSMARPQPAFETRILSILDFLPSPLPAPSLGPKALLLLVVMIPLILLAAALKPTAGEPRASRPLAPTEMEIRGRVVGANGKAVAGAKVALVSASSFNRLDAEPAAAAGPRRMPPANLLSH